jgi:ABC-2 type transport system permease protein
VARLLVQLKLRLLSNALRSSRSARAAFILSTVAVGLVAVITFAELAALRGKAASVDLTTVVFTVFAFGWLILPLLAFGLDSTLDPATLALYPLRARPLVVGAGRLGRRRLAGGQPGRPARGDRRYQHAVIGGAWHGTAVR